MRLGKGLGIAVAAIGFAGCAAKELTQKPKEVPVYSPPRELVQDSGNWKAYREVWSDGENLKLSIYMEFVDGTRPNVLSWERQEAKNSGACLKKVASLRIADLYNGREGWLESSVVDEGCDSLEVSCSAAFTPLNGAEQIDVSAELCRAPGGNLTEIIKYVEQGMGDFGYDVKEQIRLWHERKDVEE